MTMSDDANATGEADTESQRAGRATWVQWIAVVLAVVGLIVLMRLLPLEPALAALTNWIDAIGPLGMIIYGAIYVLATVLFVPGLILTIAAGAVFGLWWGTIVVSLSSTTGAGLAFLIARYVARKAVARKAAQVKTFSAIDRAIAQGGWKIVALLRLVPAVPFNALNYFFGITAIRFWPCVLTSWVAMLPGTFLYVYVGYLGRAGLQAAAGESDAVGLGRIALLIVGFIAAVVLTVYVTKLARRALKQQSQGSEEFERMAEHGAEPSEEDSAPLRSRWHGPATASVAAVVVWSLVGAACIAGPRLAYLFGPPAVVMAEAYEPRPDGPSFDHGALDRLLKAHVNSAGGVDYTGLLSKREALQQYIVQVGEAPFDELGRNEKLALLINAYNAFTLELILENWRDGELNAITDIPAQKRWNDVRWKVGEHTWSLNQIEHEQIRPKFVEPRIHWALVCAAVGCPPLRTEAYTADRLDAQLADQARRVHTNPRWVRYGDSTNMLHLTKLYDWYGDDFRQTVGSVLKAVAVHVSEVAAALKRGDEPAIGWIDYDWTLNTQERLP